MDHSIASHAYEITSFLVNPQKRLGLFSLLNILQDTAWRHAKVLGHGEDVVEAEKLFWVLTRQKVTMQSWPHWGDQLEVRTWIRPPEGPFAIRDFEILHAGAKIGEATTSWALLDAATRKPSRRMQGAARSWQSRSDGVLTMGNPKIELSVPLTKTGEFLVRNSDLDMNEHVNNTKYAQWILDSIPGELHAQFDLKEYAVNFLAETRSGDLIEIRQGELSPGQVLFQGWRAADQKAVFTARLVSSKRSV